MGIESISISMSLKVCERSVDCPRGLNSRLGLVFPLAPCFFLEKRPLVAFNAASLIGVDHKYL